MSATVEPGEKLWLSGLFQKVSAMAKGNRPVFRAVKEQDGAVDSFNSRQVVKQVPWQDVDSQADSENTGKRPFENESGGFMPGGEPRGRT